MALFAYPVNLEFSVAEYLLWLNIKLKSLRGYNNKVEEIYLHEKSYPVNLEFSRLYMGPDIKSCVGGLSMRWEIATVRGRARKFI